MILLLLRFLHACSVASTSYYSSLTTVRFGFKVGGTRTLTCHHYCVPATAVLLETTLLVTYRSTTHTFYSHHLILDLNNNNYYYHHTFYLPTTTVRLRCWFALPAGGTCCCLLPCWFVLLPYHNMPGHHACRMYWDCPRTALRAVTFPRDLVYCTTAAAVPPRAALRAHTMPVVLCSTAPPPATGSATRTPCRVRLPFALEQSRYVHNMPRP